MSQEFQKKLYAELAATQDRRHKLDMLKVSFVTALLSFGGIKIEGITSLYPLLYLVPVVAVLFDLLMMGQHFSVRRIGAYLRHFAQTEEERTYESFVSTFRDSFFKWGSRGFTLLSFAAAGILLLVTRGSLTIFELAWFGILLFAYAALAIKAYRILSSLDALKKKDVEGATDKGTGAA